MPSVLSKKTSTPLAQEKIYYLKLCKLLVEVGRPVLQNVFDAIHSPTNLPSFLSTHKVKNELLQLQKKKVLYQFQMDILDLARIGSVTSVKFDISVLIVLLRNFCNITSSPTDTVWNSEPSTADKSIAADIVRIRLCRNDLFHHTILAVTESDFEKKWDEIKGAFNRLGGGTKYEEDIQNIKVGSVDPEMEKHYHDLLRSREEAETQQAEDIYFIKTELKDVKTELKDVKQKLHESESSVTIDIKTKFKLFAAGAVTIGWGAGCTFFLNRYKDDPEIVISLVQRAILPGTLAMGATVVGILRGSIIMKVKVTSLAALDYLWKSCYDGGEMEQNLHDVIVTEELIRQAPLGTDSVGISVKMSEDDYRRASDKLRGDCHSSIPSHRKRNKSKTDDELSHKRMRRHDQTQSLLEDKCREANKASHWDKSESGCYQSEEFQRKIEFHEKSLSNSNNGQIKGFEHSFLEKAHDSRVEYGSVGPEMEKHDHDLLRSREEAEGRAVQEIHSSKTGQQNLNQKLDEIAEKHEFDSKDAQDIFKLDSRRLNENSPGVEGWKGLASRFLSDQYIDDRDIISKLETPHQHEIHSPTNKVIEWLTASKREVTVNELIQTFREIGHYDVAEILQSNLKFYCDDPGGGPKFPSPVQETTTAKDDILQGTSKSFGLPCFGNVLSRLNAKARLLFKTAQGTMEETV